MLKIELSHRRRQLVDRGEPDVLNQNLFSIYAHIYNLYTDLRSFSSAAVVVTLITIGLRVKAYLHKSIRSSIGKFLMSLKCALHINSSTTKCPQLPSSLLNGAQRSLKIALDA